MEKITGAVEKPVSSLKELITIAEELVQGGYKVTAEGMIHSIRDMGEFAFVILRSRDGLLQAVLEKKKGKLDLAKETEAAEQAESTEETEAAKEKTQESGISEKLREGEAVRITGTLREEERAPYGIELLVEEVKVLSKPAAPLPLPVDKWKMGASLEARLNQRSISLRNVRERARFRIQEGIVRGFRDFLYEQGFTEIHTPKIGAKSAEGGANIFKLSYFHHPAVLAQSPQFYKQMMVGVFDRVFETGPVFRAEKHNTKRHLNEYTSLDFEMGYIDDFREIMEMETAVLQYIMEMLDMEYEKELQILQVELPNVNVIPAVRFDEAKRLVSEKYHRPIRSPYDLEPEEEQLIGTYFKEEQGADFVFVTHYPSRKRPFYAMDDPNEPEVTLSFDLLFRGLEVTTGGQRIHDYAALLEKMASRGMTSEGMEGYLDTFRYGMPPHGGLGIGMERLTMQLLGEENVREACLFPRDLGRLAP